MHSHDIYNDIPRYKTSRSSPSQERGVLALLRDLTPRTRLTTDAATALAEAQADRLLDLAGRPQLPISTALVSQLPRVRLQYDHNLPVSATAAWTRGYWLISLNPVEPAQRIRFSTLHELKHVIDHRHVDLLYDGRELEAEAAADAFAAAVLMPRRELMLLWGQGIRRLSELSHRCDVSPLAMARRLHALGLRSDDGPRAVPRRMRPRGPVTYFDGLPPHVGGAAV